MGDEVWDAVGSVLILVAIGLIIFFIFNLAKGRRKKNNDAWKQAATELGFNFTPTGTLGKYTMSGVITDGLKQLSCTVWAHTEHYGQTHITFMNYEVSFSPSVELVSNSPHFQSKLLEANNVLKKVEVSGDSVKATRVRGFIRKSDILVQNVRLLIQLAELIIPNE
ncbi:hypothetical protein OAM96_00845 [Candidatus Poseidoniaceae archaeon]|nr:hypothetical protein [Candidatus Poseidoniaceae archaeon]|tara:strand:+ start:738 stop:1235 length:498 start_codon:yes stop_codon:yes gene_type:complete